MTIKNKYLQAKQDLKNVSKGGKDYACCSFMDISVRSERLNIAKQNYINYLGVEALNKKEYNE